MNTAIHEAFDLGWKLAWVARRWAAPALLDSYETERRPVGLRTTASSAEPDGSRDPAEALAADLGGRIPHTWLGRPKAGVSTLDLVGPGLTLLAHGGGAERAAPEHRPAQRAHVDSDIAEVLGGRAGGAELLRPDAHPVGTWSATGTGPTNVDALLTDRPAVPYVSSATSLADDALAPAI